MAKLHVHIVKVNENYYELVAISEDKITWFRIPETEKNLDLHMELLNIKTIVSSRNSITKVGGYRKVTVPFREELRKKYLDEDGNFCMDNHYLEELTTGEGSTQLAEDTSSSSSYHGSELLLINRIKELEKQISSIEQISLVDVQKKFVINKFNGRQEAVSWLESYEKECNRYSIFTDTKKIEVLKFFVEGTVLEWYASNLIKLSLSHWGPWKQSFLLVFEKTSWASIRTAFGFKFVGGSMIDYAIKKERLLLEADKNIAEQFRIYQIVYGLPIEIQDKLDREKIDSFEYLLTELKKLNTTLPKKKFIEKEKEKNFEAPKMANMERKPCNICEKLGFKNRYHPMQLCRNKGFQSKQYINVTEETDSDEEQINAKN